MISSSYRLVAGAVVPRLEAAPGAPALGVYLGQHGGEIQQVRPGLAGDRLLAQQVAALMTSSRVRAPRKRLPSWATWAKKWITCSGTPVNLARRSSCWVAIPVGQVLVALAGHVAADGDHRPSRSHTPRPPAGKVLARPPVLSPPSVRTRMRPLRSFITSTCWVSARPISQGQPAFS